MFVRILSIFKTFRALNFAICMMLSIGCATILSIFLLRQWNDFDLISRIIIVILAVVHSLGAILLYLMIVVKFRVWLDAARVSVYLSAVLCGALLLIFKRARLPCSGSGIEGICTQTTLFVVIASFIISGLLLIYALGLAIIAHTIPRPLLAKAPSDIEEGLTTVNSRTSLIPSTDKSEARDFQRDDQRHSSDAHADRHVHGLARHHALQPLNFTNRSERAALPPVFNYTVRTSSPTTTSSLPTPMSSEMSYKTPLIQHPYAVSSPLYSSGSPPLSGYYSRPVTPLPQSALSSTSDSLRMDYPQWPSTTSTNFIPAQTSPSNDTTAYGVRPLGGHFFQLTRSESAMSAPANLGGVSHQAPPIFDHFLPNPFQDPVSRSTTPNTPSTFSSGAHVHTGTPIVSLSFGSRGFPLPPSYNVTSWSQYTREYLKSYTSNQPQTPPSTPLSLRPRFHVEAKQSSSLVLAPRRPLSFGSIAASLHSANLPSPPTPAARLLPHPRLQAHLETTSSPDAMSGSTELMVGVSHIDTVPTSAKTLKSQLLPTDIPHWLASEHSKGY